MALNLLINETGADPNAAAGLDSLFDMVMAGGPMMIPIGLCSVVALAFAVERSVKLRPGYLGNRKLGRTILDTYREQGADQALEFCEKSKTPMARIFAEALKRVRAPFTEMEKAVEDAGAREVKRLSANLRPLVVVGMIAPLLGLLGTVWGMIDAFKNVALNEGLGKPEMLAAGISQALITTATGLAIAIPAQAAYFWLRAKIEKFTRQTEDAYVQFTNQLLENRG